MVTEMDRTIMRTERGRALPVIRKEGNIPLISLENYEIVRRELFSRPRKAALPRDTESRKDERKKE